MLAKLIKAFPVPDGEDKEGEQFVDLRQSLSSADLKHTDRQAERSGGFAEQLRQRRTTERKSSRSIIQHRLIVRSSERLAKQQHLIVHPVQHGHTIQFEPVEQRCQRAQQ